jgi:hypothetical protein
MNDDARKYRTHLKEIDSTFGDPPSGLGKHRDEEPKQRPTKITEKDTSFTA